MTTRIIIGDALTELAKLPDESVHCCVTSPPYFGLRDYGVAGQLGLEPTPAEYIAAMVAVFREVRRVLRGDGTLWLNIGDSYAGSWGAQSRKETPAGLHGNQIANHPKAASHTGAIRQAELKPKDLIGIPWALAFALRDDGWWLRKDIIWSKKAPMPESVIDRPTSAHEYVFLLSKSARYFYDAEAVKEVAETAGQSIKMADGWDTGAGGHGTIHRQGREKGKPNNATQASTRNMRDVWHLGPEPFPEAHFATFISEVPRRSILAGTSERGVCPQCGAPWERETKTDYENPGNRTTNGPRSLAQRHETAGFAVRLEKRVETLGWRRGCACGTGDPVPATVIDPFLGSGTTALVADQLGRDCIGIEINPDYAAMAERRIRKDAGLFAEIA